MPDTRLSFAVPKAFCALLMLALTYAVLGAKPANAHSSQAEFEEHVRAFLLKNPTVILESLELLSQREAKLAMARKIAQFPELFSEPPVLGLGAMDAPIRIVEFFDYRCAPCKTLHPRLAAALAKYPDIRVEMRQLPILSPASERAARFARAVLEVAGSEAYARIHQRLWTHKGPMNGKVFQSMAATENLDWPKVEQALQSAAVSQRIDENRDIAIALEILGTPAFIAPQSVHVGTSDVEGLIADWLSQ